MELNCPTILPERCQCTFPPLVHDSVFLHKVNNIEYCQYFNCSVRAKSLLYYFYFWWKWIYFKTVMAVSLYCIPAFLCSFHFFLWEFMSISLLWFMLGIINLLLHTLQVFFFFCHFIIYNISLWLLNFNQICWPAL